MRRCGNCKLGEVSSPDDAERLGNGQYFVWCKATGPKLLPGGNTSFPTMKFSGSCALHTISLWKLFKGDGTRT